MSSKNNFYLFITISGIDGPGITAAITSIIHNSNYRLVDINQAVTYHFLSLQILVQANTKFKDNKTYFDSECQSNNFIINLIDKCKELNLNLSFNKVESNQIELQKKEIKKAYIVSCVSSKEIKSDFISSISLLLSKRHMNIQKIERKSNRDFKSLNVEVNTPTKGYDETIKNELYQIGNNYHIDTAIIPKDIYIQNKRLICFDMDSTLIQAEVINLMANKNGAGEIVSKITESAMNGELDFKESLTKRVATLKGMKRKELKEIANKLPLTDGVEELIKTIKPLGYKIAIISGGFTFFANKLKETLGLDFVLANELEFDENDLLTGKIKGNIVDAQKKAEYLEELAKQEQMSLSQVVAVGDGANDLMMLSKAGLGIAFQAKEVVRQSADSHLSFGPMSHLLYFLGVPPKV